MFDAIGKTRVSKNLRFVSVVMFVTYGAERWQMTEKTRKRIDCVEMDYLRRACRISRREHMSTNEIRRRINRIYRISERIEPRQLIWYVQRINENKWPKRALDNILERECLFFFFVEKIVCYLATP